MTAYFCPDRGTWSTEMCDPDKCVGFVTEHALRHVGPDKIVQMMNAIDMANASLVDTEELVEAVAACIEWMGDPLSR